MADLDIARLRALLAQADKGVRARDRNSMHTTHTTGGLHRTTIQSGDKAEIDLCVAAVNALPALLDAADLADPETLRFGPRTKHGWRTAVAADGETYSIRDGDGFFVLSSVDAFEHGDGSNAFKTESEAIEAAREHDRARRGAK